MALTLVVTPDNQFAPADTTYAYAPDQLIAGSMQKVTHNVLLQSGVLLRGTVLGRQSNVSITLAPAITNTGNGTIGAISPGTTLQTGTYAITATSPTVFAVTDPEGNALGNATVGSAFSNSEINFTLTAGGTLFAAGDSFTLTSSRSDGNFVACVKTASDGSQNPACILADNADASAGPVLASAYFTGEFNANAVFYDSSWLLNDVRAALQPRNIHLRSPVTAAVPVNGTAY